MVVVSQAPSGEKNIYILIYLWETPSPTLPIHVGFTCLDLRQTQPAAVLVPVDQG